MFFAFSKLVTPFFLPLNFILLLLVAGAVMVACRKGLRWGRGLIGIAVALYVFIGIFPAGYDGLVWLEGRHPRPAVLPARADGILILGGSIDTKLSTARDTVAMTSQAERIFEGLVLARKYPYAVLVYSGGDNRFLAGGDPDPETAHIEVMLAELGIDPLPVFFEDESRNTFENIQNSMRLAQPQPEETWILVTSAYHMRRAASVMQSIGWPSSVVYWPVDYRTDGQYRFLPDKLDVGRNFDNANVALHELLGWLTYRFTGRINPRGEGLH